MSNFSRCHDLPLINSEIEPDLSWSKECIISEISITPAKAGNQNATTPAADRPVRQTAGSTFQMNNAKTYVLVVTLSINNNIKFLEDIKQRFKTTISWNKYRSEIITQSKNNNLDYYLIDPLFRNINRLFALSFKNGNNDPTRDSLEKYYMPLVEIKDFNSLIDNKSLFDQPLKNKQETYEKLIEESRNNDYSTVNLLDFLYHQNYYKLILVRGDITITTAGETQVAFKNCAPFTIHIRKIDGTTIDD